jgi:hypothetical protein
MRNHLKINAACIHIVQTQRAKITQPGLSFGIIGPIRAARRASGSALHDFPESRREEMFFNGNSSHVASFSTKL